MKALEIRGMLCRLDEIKNDLRALQHAVDGYIECVHLGDAVMIVDEEGLCKGKPYNALASLIAHTCIYGTALVVGVDGEKFTDCPAQYVKSYLSI
jgi:hypothetical protein